MQKIVLGIAILGGLLMIGAAMLAIDTLATPDRKEAVQTAINRAVEQSSEQSGRKNPIGSAAKGYKSLMGGIFSSSPITIADHLPPAPDGWTGREFAPDDVDNFLRLTGTDDLRVDATRYHLFSELPAIIAQKTLGAAATYQKGDRMMIFWGQGFKQAFRDASDGKKVRKYPVRLRFAKIDGVDVGMGDGFVRQYSNIFPVPFRHITVKLDGFAHFNLVANASDADIMALLKQIDMAALQELLPRQTAGYAPGTGAVYASEKTPSAELPTPSKALLAYEAVIAGADLNTVEGKTLRRILEGKVTDWNGANSGYAKPIKPTETLIRILGPVDEDHASNR